MDEVSLPEDVSCTECGRVMDDPKAAEAEGWRFLPAGVDHPHPFCPECAEREFGPAK
jgi:hypothetical protein